MSQKLSFVLALVCLLAVGTGVATAGLVGYWPMNEGQGTVVKDASGNGNDGTMVGAPTYVAGLVPGSLALKFNGTSDAVDLGNKAVFNPTGSFSVSLWANITTWTSAWGCVMMSNRGESGIGWQVRRYSSNRLCFTTRGVGNDDMAGNLTPVPTGTWLHIACVYDNTANVKYLYVNGVMDQHLSTTAGATVVATTNDTYIGARSNGSTGLDAAYFTGILQEVRFYNSALTAADVAQLAVVPVAIGPAPADKATDVRLDPTLSWTPGTLAKTHNVYFGASFTDVNVATTSSALCVSKGKSATSYALTTLLARDQTYYWRVDEVNPDATVAKGNVWGFSSEPTSYTLAAASITATASSTQSGGASAQVTAGGTSSGLDATTLLQSSDMTKMWLSGTGASAWIQYKFDKIYKLTSMWVWNYNAQFEATFLGLGVKTATVAYSTDGTTWTTWSKGLLAPSTLNQGPGADGYACNNKIPFGVGNIGITAQYVKITASGSFNGQNNQYGLSSVRFFYIPEVAREPSPASAATGVNPNGTSLTWRATREAPTYTVQFGTDRTAVNNGVSVLLETNQNNCVLGPLDLGRAYYWRIDSVNYKANPIMWLGDLWSFTARTYNVADDFESYTSVAGNKVFDYWTDGMVSTGVASSTNGGLVGYDDNTVNLSVTPIVNHPNYLEPTVVDTLAGAGSTRSMPFRYGVNTAASVSEATLNVAKKGVSNWTLNKADTLRLFVYSYPLTFLEVSPGTIYMSGTGADVYTNIDGFRMAYKQLTGDGWIIARVDYAQATDTWAKAGVMIRVGDQPGAQEGNVELVPGTNTTIKQAEWSFRPTTGDTAARSVQTANPTTPEPRWVKVERVGNVINGYYRPDSNSAWTQTFATTLASQTITMPDPVNIGLFVCSHNTGLVMMAKFSNVSTSSNVTGPWQTMDVTTQLTPNNTRDLFYVKAMDSTGGVSPTFVDTEAAFIGGWKEIDIPFSAMAPLDVTQVKSLTIGVGSKTNPLHGVGTLFIDDVQLIRTLP